MEEILDSFEEQSEKEYQLASKGKRFANYLIDLIGYYLLSILIGLAIGGYIVSSGNDDVLVEDIFMEETSSNWLLEWVLGMVIISIYYVLQEYYLKGKTLGKYLTNTRAVDSNNARMDFSTTLKRTLCRLIPFEAFSFLGEDSKGWHDSISGTKVIVDQGWYDE